MSPACLSQGFRNVGIYLKHIWDFGASPLHSGYETDHDSHIQFRRVGIAHHCDKQDIAWWAMPPYGRIVLIFSA